MLRVRMLGGLSILLDDRRLHLDCGLSGRLFVSYLFKNVGKAHRRERLAEKFWGQLGQEKARAALNTALWRLRKLLAAEQQSKGGANLVSHSAEIALEPESWLSIDTHSFEQSLREAFAQGRHSDNSTATRLFERGVSEYGGPFLDGDDDAWVLEERERLHSMYLRAMGELVRLHALAGSYEDAICVAKQILTADTFRESVQRQLMLLLVLNGQRAEAIKQFSHWRTALRRELGIDPVPQTLALCESVRSGEIVRQLDSLRLAEFAQPGHAVK